MMDEVAEGKCFDMSSGQDPGHMGALVVGDDSGVIAVQSSIPCRGWSGNRWSWFFIIELH